MINAPYEFNCLSVSSNMVSVLPVDVDTGLDTMGCDVEGPDSSGNLMTGLACGIGSSSKAVISGPLVATEKYQKHYFLCNI